MKNNNRADVDNIHKQITKTVDFENITKEFLDDRIHTLITDWKIKNKINRNADSYYVYEKEIDTKITTLTKYFSSYTRKSIYTPKISILIQSTENPLISPNEALMKKKWTNL